MFVRFASYRMRQEKDAEDWLDQHADEVRSAPGVKQVHFLQNVSDENQVAAVVFFESEEDMDAYIDSDVFEQVVNELRANWVDPSAEVDQRQFEVLG